MKYAEIGWKAVLSALLAVFFTVWIDPGSDAGKAFLFFVSFLFFYFLIHLISRLLPRRNGKTFPHAVLHQDTVAPNEGSVDMEGSDGASSEHAASAATERDTSALGKLSPNDQ